MPLHYNCARSVFSWPALFAQKGPLTTVVLGLMYGLKQHKREIAEGFDESQDMCLHLDRTRRRGDDRLGVDYSG